MRPQSSLRFTRSWFPPPRPALADTTAAIASNTTITVDHHRTDAAANADPKTTIAVQYGCDLTRWTTALNDAITSNNIHHHRVS